MAFSSPTLGLLVRLKLSTRINMKKSIHEWYAVALPIILSKVLKQQHLRIGIPYLIKKELGYNWAKKELRYQNRSWIKIGVVCLLLTMDIRFLWNWRRSVTKARAVIGSHQPISRGKKFLIAHWLKQIWPTWASKYTAHCYKACHMSRLRSESRHDLPTCPHR